LRACHAAEVSTARQRPAPQHGPVLAVGLGEGDGDVVVAGGGDGQAGEVGGDRKFAPAAVDQHDQRDPRRAAEVEEFVERGAHGAAGEEDIVDQDDGAPVEREGDVGRPDDGLFRQAVEVVAVEGDVEAAERQVAAEPRGERRLQAPGEDVAAALDPDQAEVVGLAEADGDRLGEAAEERGDPGRVEQDRLAGRAAGAPGASSRSPPGGARRSPASSRPVAAASPATPSAVSGSWLSSPRWGRRSARLSVSTRSWLQARLTGPTRRASSPTSRSTTSW
jgi:hypothetical protein